MRAISSHSLAGTLALICQVTACQSSGVVPGSVQAAGAPSVAPIGSPTLSPTEGRIRDYVRAHHEEDVSLLERAVNISSGTHNLAGVRQVGNLFAVSSRCSASAYDGRTCRQACTAPDI